MSVFAITFLVVAALFVASHVVIHPVCMKYRNHEGVKSISPIWLYWNGFFTKKDKVKFWWYIGFKVGGFFGMIIFLLWYGYNYL